MFGLDEDDVAGSPGEFLGRVQFDARTGFWKVVDRVQNLDGKWSDQESDLFKSPSYLFDFGSFETGYIRFGSPPVFLVSPVFDPKPERPNGADGKPDKKGYPVGFRVKLLSTKAFGDDKPRYWASTSKNVCSTVEALFKAFCAAPEAANGKVPLVKEVGTRTIEVQSKEGVSKFKVPDWQIVGWYDRPETLGDRTVAAPVPVDTSSKAPVENTKPTQAAAKPKASSISDDEIPF